MNHVTFIPGYGRVSGRIWHRLRGRKREEWPDLAGYRFHGGEKAVRKAQSPRIRLIQKMHVRRRVGESAEK